MPCQTTPIISRISSFHEGKNSHIEIHEQNESKNLIAAGHCSEYIGMISQN
ncbi:hypothetical protein LEAN103870_19630 [Legionella anisa]|uniref:hypothetical protein n=1 Tax=Legionella anisa TaxID=28082 RepID=UPI0003477DB0|nr:hypothetical protein [Legionella anisa]KTC73727.1 hypothetical protein Lani_0818 [Legionella anisa]MBN5937408.1 hypothetical protein [Legionella anisa]MCW8426338.1 hypothetical protein [Legionella anisa]MCW8447998.1 hypothetical protein [Legionella anisa]UAK78626.1 hypothetical protein K8O89_13280 [Legionella anisa]